MAIPIIVISLLVVVFLKEIPLRSGKIASSSKPAGNETEIDTNVPAFTGH